MTYWVISRFGAGIYMAADIRVSRQGDQHGLLRDYSDTSEKLFAIDYKDKNNNWIKAGLCTSGFAASAEATIADIINNYIELIKERKRSFNSAQDLIKYLVDTYLPSIDFSPKLHNDLIKNTNFGVGMIIKIGSKNYLSIASWNGKSVEDYTDFGYLESSFSPICLKALYGDDPNFKDDRGNLSVKKVLQFVASKNDFKPLEFTSSIIWTAANTGAINKNASQSISTAADVLEIEPSKHVYLKRHPKEDARRANFDKPIAYGTDRVPVTMGSSSRPAVPDLRDMTVSGRSGGHREQEARFAFFPNPGHRPTGLDLRDMTVSGRSGPRRGNG